jgi:hypothetical protein
MSATDERMIERMAPTYADAAGGASVRDVLRVLRAVANVSPSHGLVTQVTSSTPLEVGPADGDPPRLEAAAPIEGDALTARAVPGSTEAAFGAFLDGIQSSRVVAHWASGVPLVHGTVAAVVRVRTERVLSTWTDGLRVARSLFVPVALAGEERVRVLRARGLDLVDTLDGDAPLSPRHPQELLGLARSAVQRRREQFETGLAEAWCAREQLPLLVDGGISGTAARSPLAVGVVKSHRTLYAAPESVGVVVGLAEAARTTAFAIRSPRRTAVASWYLRLRDPAGRDPFFGLVRIEIAQESFSPARADDVSRWVLAERAPVSLPDRRWSTMTYGVRNAEEYLRAIAR